MQANVTEEEDYDEPSPKANQLKHCPLRKRSSSLEFTKDTSKLLDVQNEKVGIFKRMQRTFQKYDKSILMVLCLAYFVQGFKIFLLLSIKDLFKDYLKLDPTQSQTLNSIINIPWSFKIFYGLIADNVPILGSRRRSYLVLNGLLYFISLVILSLNLISDYFLITLLLTITSLNGAFTDVVVDALMVAQSRSDKDNGSEDLQSLSWSMLSIGGICGSIASAYFTEYLHPYQTFGTLSVVGLIQAYFGWRINKELEKSTIQIEQTTFTEQLKSNLQQLKIAIKMPLIQRTVAYLLICGFFIPSFSEFGYYFQLNIVQFSKQTYSFLQIFGFVSLLVAVFIYSRYFRDKEISKLILYAQYIHIFGGTVSLLYVLRVNVYYGISDITVIIFSSLVTDTIGLAFTLLPQLVLFAKITPQNIEATVFAILTGMNNLCAGVLSPMVGVFVNKAFVGVSIDNLEKYWVLVTISLCCTLIPILINGLLPRKKEIEELQALFEKDSRRQDHNASVQIDDAANIELVNLKPYSNNQ
ncbi:UNKNOWN [Stylonychia lemnae]|uniref:Uncharacterized protein n=1 Tax=Stylonychia lemnae TaxID=5949 RepID=A0A078AHW4_STYLE|nr:UNKNOWN [Stylonychia lemnae]|eukprot:CDW81496.1 UNKNOWN [Stylonychia lemnae]